jgi:molybdenum cofactor cytidylyltransferase
MITAIVLAAGASRRFGRHKLLASFRGAPLVRHAVGAAVAMPVDEVVVVVGRDAAAVRAAVGEAAVRWHEHPEYEAGIGGSLAAAVGALRRDVEAALVLLGDQPTVRPAAGAALIAEWRRTGAAVVVPAYRDDGGLGRGHPVLFDASVFPELRALRGDVGARSVIAARPERVARLGLDWPAPADVDTAEDLARLAEESPAR